MQGEGRGVDRFHTPTVSNSMACWPSQSPLPTSRNSRRRCRACRGSSTTREILLQRRKEWQGFLLSNRAFRCVSTVQPLAFLVPFATLPWYRLLLFTVFRRTSSGADCVLSSAFLTTALPCDPRDPEAVADACWCDPALFLAFHRHFLDLSLTFPCAATNRI